MLKKQSYISRDEIENLVENRIISKEAGAKILAELASKTTNDVGFWFWILPILGALLIVYGMTGLMGTAWDALSQMSQISILSITGVSALLLWIYTYRCHEKENMLAEITGIITSVVIIFELLFGMNLHDSVYITGAREFYILSLGFPVILWIMWSMRSLGAAIAYYAYMGSMFFADHHQVWPYPLVFILGLLPLCLAYYWYQNSKSIHLMLFNWAFTIVGIMYIVQYFWVDYIGLTIALVMSLFLVSFAKSKVSTNAFIAWRIFGLPSMLIIAGMSWEWVQDPQIENMTDIFYLWYAVGIIAVALVLKYIDLESCAKMVGYSMLVQLLVVLALLVSSFYYTSNKMMIATIYDVFLGLQGAWIIANGVRKKNLFFINLGVIFVIIFTFLLSMTYKEISNTEMSWILIGEGICFVMGNIFFSRRERIGKDEI